MNDVTTGQFRRHIETALDAGFRFAPASQVARGGCDERTLAISFDDGMKSVVTTAAPILKEYGLPFSFFPVSDWCEGREPAMDGRVLTWRDVEVLLEQGAELGSHSATHADFSALDVNGMVDELGESRDMIQKRIGFAPDSFAIPFGQSGNWSETAHRCALEAGYSIVYAQSEDSRTTGTIPRSFVTRFDGKRIFRALLAGKYDAWEEWV